MSMRVPYTPPDYVAPTRDGAFWVGPERRSLDPVNQLARSLNQLCLEASDRFEIVAHLEALGLNSPEALEELGFDDPFDLARDLYARTPRAFTRQRCMVERHLGWLGPIAMVLTLAVTFPLGAFSGTQVLIPAIWVLLWSQLGATLLARAPGDLAAQAQDELLAIVMHVGLAVLLAMWALMRFEVNAAAPAFLWFGVAGSMWSERLRLALALPLVVAVSLAASLGWELEPSVTPSVTVAAAVALSTPILLDGSRRSFAWILRHRGSLPFPAAYGLGQGLLIITLLRDGPTDGHLLAGAVLLATILLTSRALLLALKNRLMRLSWGATNPRRFVTSARRAILAYAATYLIPLVVAIPFERVGTVQTWSYHWYAFALFGLCLALAVASLTLGDTHTPGVTFLAAGVFALFGSFLMACIVLAMVQLVVLLRRCARIERYVVHLL